MRVLALLGLVAVLGGAPDAPSGVAPHPAHEARPTRLAQLSGSAAGLFLRLVNEQLMGRIEPRSVSFEAPAGVVLEDVIVTAPGGRPVARVKRARASVSLSALLSGEIAISKLEIDEPKLILEIKDGKLNLLEAFTPRKKSDPNDTKPSGAFRIDEIVVSGGGFRLNDGQNVTLVFDDINGRATLDVDLGREVVVVDAGGLSVGSGSVKIEALDVPVGRVTAQRIKLITDKLEVTGLSGTVLGGVDGKGPRATFTANGRINVKDAGNLQVRARVESAAGAWPDRLAPLDFTTPAASLEVNIDGPFENPAITINGTYSRTELYGYVLDGGTARAVIDKSRVVVADGTSARVGRGTVRATGVITLPISATDTPSTPSTPKKGASKPSDNVQVDLRVRVDRAPLALALAPAKLDTTLRGSLSGHVRVTGHAGKETELLIDGDIGGRSLELFDIRLPSEIDGDVRVKVTPTRVVIEKAIIGDPLGGLRAAVSGDIDIKGESLSLTVDADSDDPGELVVAIPAEVDTGATHFAGTIKGPYKAVVVEGDATMKNGDAYGTPFNTLAAHVRVTPKEVRVERGTAIVAGGVFSQSQPLVMGVGRHAVFSSGTFHIDNGDLSLIKTPDGEDLPITGIVDLEAVLRGPIREPRVLVRASGARLVVADELLGQAQVSFVVTKDALTFDTVNIRGGIARASGSALRLDLNTLRMTGVVNVDELDLADIKNAESARLRGRARGLVVIDGDVRMPTLRADLAVVQLQVADFVFGDGRVSLGLAPDPAGGEKALSVSASASTTWDLGHYDVRASYAIDRQVIAADIKLRDVDLVQLRPWLPEDAIVPFVGLASGSVVASGPIDALDAVIKLRIPDLVAEVPDATLPEKHRLRPFGPVFLDVRLDDGALLARLCAFPDAGGRAAPVDDSVTGAGSGAGSGTGPSASTATSVDVGCRGPHRLWGAVTGRIQPLAGAYAVLGDFAVDADRIEELVPALLARDVGLSTWARIALRYEQAAAPIIKDGSKGGKKGPAPPSTLAVSAAIRDLIVRPPGAPVVRIAKRFDLTYANGRAVIGETPARFVTARDGVDLVIAAGSSVGADDIDVSVDGELALSVLKLFSSEIANASGTAATHIKIAGKFDDGVRIEGTVRPQAGARLTVRSLGQPLIFEEGQISVSPDVVDPRRIVVSFDTPCSSRSGLCPMRAAFGEGRVQLRGSAIARTSKSEVETWIERFDLAVSGAAVEVRTSVGRAESSFDLALTGDAPAPVLSGRIEVSDGLFKKDFQIRNFVLSEAPSRPSTPLWQTLQPFGLGGLTFNVDASMQNVRVKARINAFSVDTSLRGELRLGRSLKLPAIDGAIEVEEGSVDFPRARFEILEMQVQFPTSPEGTIDPLVHVAARTELQPGAAGNDVEVPIDLTLDGTFDLMQLDLVATDPNRQWSRTELFAYVLFGTVPAGDGGFVSTGANVAARAAWAELTAPVSDELEQIALNEFGLDANIDVVSGWQLQLGRRLVVEGQGFLSQGLTTTDSATTTTTTATNGTDALRVRLLFYDHLPLGKAISAEGRFGAASDLRLSYRLFEE